MPGDGMPGTIGARQRDIEWWCGGGGGLFAELVDLGVRGALGGTNPPLSRRESSLATKRLQEREAVVSRMRPWHQKRPRDEPDTKIQGGLGMDSRAHITCSHASNRCKPTETASAGQGAPD